MAFVPVPVDLKNIKTKFALNLTKRQCICYPIAGFLGITVYRNLYNKFPIDFVMLLTIGAAFPFFLLSEKEVEGMPMEKYFAIKIRFMLTPKERVYMTENRDSIERKKARYRKEIKKIESRAYAPSKRNSLLKQDRKQKAKGYEKLSKQKKS